MKKHYRREWLNTKQGRAYAISEVTQELGNKPGNKEDEEHPYPGALSEVYASLELGDCNKSIVLDFSAYSKEEVLEKLVKLQRLLRHLDSLSVHLTEAVDKLPTKAQVKEYHAARRKRRGPIRPLTVGIDDL